MSCEKLYRILRYFLVVNLFVLTILFGSSNQVAVLAGPVTPKVAAHEIQQADTTEEAGQRIQAQSQDYKKELEVSPKPIQNGAKTVADNMRSFFRLVTQRIQESLSQSQ